MKHSSKMDRRRLLAGAMGAGLLGGCDRIAQNDGVQRALASAESLSRRVQTLLTGSRALAREFSDADLSPAFRANGTTDPDDEDYQDLADKEFADWKLEVAGLVETPLQLSLAELRAMPARTQITRHDCVEGWSCIGKWTGAVLGPVLQRAGLKEQARYIVFYCADPMDGNPATKYYESIDLGDAFHPQTILAYDMNGKILTVPHGAPLRLRAERNLGYKMAKYVMKIEAVESFANIGGGKGGYWEDNGYAWFAGI